MQFMTFFIPRRLRMRLSARKHSHPSNDLNTMARITPNKTLTLVALGLFILVRHGFALGPAHYVETIFSESSFPIVQGNTAATVQVDANDFAGVVRAAGCVARSAP